MAKVGLSPCQQVSHDLKRENDWKQITVLYGVSNRIDVCRKYSGSTKKGREPSLLSERMEQSHMDS